MSQNLKKIAVFTSGGDAPGMNAALRAVVRSAHYNGLDCFGIRDGFNGLISGDIIEMTPRSVKNIINLGGTILRSARSEEFRTPLGREKAFHNCQEKGIEALVCIGGDGSFTGSKIFGEEFGLKIIGIPGTIDNDIFGTDNTIGFDTALNTAMEAIDKIRDTAVSHSRIFFVEVMGRDAGFIALHCGIASGATDILIPEMKDSRESLFGSIKKANERGKNSCIIVVAEGEELGNVVELAKITEKEFPEASVRFAVLGHIQRGGNPSCADRVLASRLGNAAIDGLLAGKSMCMAGIRANQIIYTPFEEAIQNHNEINTDLLKVAEVLAI